MSESVDDPRIRYVVAVLLGKSPDEFVWPNWFVYRHDWPEGLVRGVQVIPSGFFGSGYGKGDSLPELPLPTLEGIPVLYGGDRVCQTGERIVVTADILASAFFLLTRYEEWVRPTVRDSHGRFPGQGSLPLLAGVLDRPIVEEYRQLFGQWLRRIGIEIAHAPTTFSAVITHDVDTLGCRRGLVQAIRRVGGFVVGRRPWRESLELAKRDLGLSEDPCGDLGPALASGQELVRRVGSDRVRQIFFFMAEGEVSLDRSYEIEGQRAREAVEKVLASGAEVGLHASYEAGEKPELIAGERQALEQVAGRPVAMNRHHYLRWREPGDGFQVAASGIRSDYTLGYADVAGFRLGVCRPVPLFDPAEQRLVGIEEHPLIVMDCSLSNANYMNLDEEQAFACVCNLIDRVAEHDGEFVMLWHHNILCPASGNYHPSLYPRVLDYLSYRLTGVRSWEDQGGHKGRQSCGENCGLR
jgi:hypothetical protein